VFYAMRAHGRARYFGTLLEERSLTPGDNPRLGSTRFEEWLARSLPGKRGT
jgi:hypothetical protein